MVIFVDFIEFRFVIRSAEMSESNCYLNRLPIANTTDNIKQVLTVRTIWKEDVVTVGLLIENGSNGVNDHRGYIGEMRRVTLKEIAKNLEIPYSEFLDETKRALCTSDGLPNFNYSFDGQTFSWLKVRSQKLGLKSLYGKCKVQPTENMMSDMLSSSIVVIAEFNAQQKTIENQLSELRQAQIDLQLAFDKYIDDKQRIEERNLTKFILLLNSKKEKIARYENVLAKLGRDELITTSTAVPSKRKTNNDVEKNPAAMTVSCEGKVIPRTDKLPKRMKKTTAIADPTEVGTSGLKIVESLRQLSVEAKSNDEAATIYNCDTQELFENM